MKVRETAERQERTSNKNEKQMSNKSNNKVIKNDECGRAEISASDPCPWLGRGAAITTP